ncbi:MULTISPECIES: LysR family transcriptional regulator [Burkholderiaceae]|uniref:LysR family transcriptional regulator n=1 Tax=Caballeronia zhejiangensis TaxID=871203 RepID=A0A656QFT1_9BURK|nr:MULTISPECIES: LysR family transcriptional regulator [Burkholderiaceae]KAK43830.1 LysR family transcriptional regulator [Caballeronia jiangsuensis]KDR25879.1 LysR family transcriptional regulator [Caballeronia zhejiangensis]KWU23786.1 LysR family transcriptional regulator [Burkholderia cenocepacia]SAL78333.1 LysR family transcriptional regulator [Caballeronia peredens]
MSLDRMDLNLLRVFDAVYEDRNLVLAGKRLNLSQSAISHALGRMRQVVGDDLFVRTGQGMVPTVRATKMAGQVRGALAQIRAALGVDLFVPAEARRKFVVAANDYITSLLVGRLSQRLSAEAPMVDLVVRPSTRLDLAGQIDVGRIDIAIGIFSDIPSRFQSMKLWQQTDVLLLHRNHPAADRELSKEDLLWYPLVVVSLGGEEEGAVGGFILERGLARQSEMFDRRALERGYSGEDEVPRVRVSVAHSLAMPALLSYSEMIAVLPSSLARELERFGELKIHQMPYDCPDVDVTAVWHERNDSDPGMVWLRQQLTDVARQVRGR